MISDPPDIPDPPLGEKPAFSRVLSVKFCPKQPTDPSTNDNRVHGFLSALLGPGRCTILPFHNQSLPPILPSESWNPPPNPDDILHYFPHTPGTTNTTHLFGKLSVTSAHTSFGDLKRAIMSTLQQYSISLNITPIITGTSDIYVGWLYNSLPRFFNFTLSTSTIAELTNTDPSSFHLTTQTIKIGEATTEAVTIMVDSSLARTFTQKLLTAFSDDTTPKPPVLTNLEFIPKSLPHDNQVTCILKHNEYRDSLSYTYIQNLGDIDTPINTSPSIRSSLIQLIPRLAGIHQSNNSNDPVTYILYPQEDTNTLTTITSYIQTLKLNHPVHHFCANIDVDVLVGPNNYYVSSSPTKRRRTPPPPQEVIAFAQRLSTLASKFPARQSTPVSKPSSNASYASALTSRITPPLKPNHTPTPPPHQPPLIIHPTTPTPPSTITGYPQSPASTEIDALRAEMKELKTIVFQLVALLQPNPNTTPPSPPSQPEPTLASYHTAPIPTSPAPTAPNNTAPLPSPMTLDTLNYPDIRMSYGKNTLTQLTPLRKKQHKSSHNPSPPLPANEQRGGNQ